MIKVLLQGIAFGAVVFAQSDPKASAPLQLDKTGVTWSASFAAALARAKAERRLIFVPVIAGGTDKTGCW